jgi:hypothetical protein
VAKAAFEPVRKPGDWHGQHQISESQRDISFETGITAGDKISRIVKIFGDAYDIQ